MGVLGLWLHQRGMMPPTLSICYGSFTSDVSSSLGPTLRCLSARQSTATVSGSVSRRSASSCCCGFAIDFGIVSSDLSPLRELFLMSVSRLLRSPSRSSAARLSKPRHKSGSQPTVCFTPVGSLIHLHEVVRLEKAVDCCAKL